MRIAIVEDHAAERQLMAVMCAEYFKRTRDIGVECVTFADAESFIESWKDARYDLLLLDCYLSGDETATHAATGLDIARTLRRQNDDCPIVFITSSTDFAVLGYEVQASGYLLKPLNHDAFHATMDRVAAQLDTKTPVTHLKKTSIDGQCTKQHGRRMAGGVRQSRHHHGPSPYRLRAFQRALCGIHLRRRHLRENPHQLLRCGTSSHRIQQLLPHRARSARQLRLRVRHQQQ